MQDIELNQPELAVPKKKKKWKLKFFLIFFLVIGFAFYFCFLRPYSSGFREGYVTKLSKKGFVFKTWEGELSKTVISPDPNPWKYSVASSAIADSLNNIDQRVYVKLHYNEYIFQIFFKGDTKYFIDKIQKMPAMQNQEIIIPR